MAFNNTHDSSQSNRSSSNGTQIAGRTMKRITALEISNQSLRDELEGIQRWKRSMEKWMLEEFGYSIPNTEEEHSVDWNGRDETTETESEDGFENGGSVTTYNEDESGRPLNSPSRRNPDPNFENPNVKPVLNNVVVVPSPSTPQRLVPGTSTSTQGAYNRQDSSSSASYPKNPSPKMRNSNSTSPIQDPDRHKWGIVSKRPKTPSTLDGDPACNVCKDLYPEMNNEMVFCDECNLCVHQACYGITVLPEDGWKCKTCIENIPPNTQDCRFCTIKGGAMVRIKTPSKNAWAHTACVIWIPKVTFNDPSKMDIAVGIPNIDKSRWKLKCGICKDGYGKTCCIQCSHKRCVVAFHVTCAFANPGYKMLMKDDNSGKDDGVILQSYCPTHADKGDVFLNSDPSTSSPNKKRKKRNS